MKLHFLKLGQGHPLVILHGLYGSGDNWLTIARELAGICTVYLPDQRNHGKSPHTDSHTYDDLVADLLDFLDQQEIKKCILMGHSMGGKAALAFASRYPSRISKLIVVDISPADFGEKENRTRQTGFHRELTGTLRSMPVERFASLREASKAFSEKFSDLRLGQFMLKNLTRVPEGGFRWRINLEALEKHLPEIARGLDAETLKHNIFRQFPILFIRGGKSQYFTEEDVVRVREMLPMATVSTIKNGGHWLHAEEPALFTAMVKRFILD